mgnify:CR=1 FL=1
MKILLIVNPVSGGEEKDRFMKEAEKLCRRYGIKYKAFETTGKDDREKIQRRVESFDPDRIVAVGGDGTVLLTVTAVLDTDHPVGIVPMGSANGMAEELGVNPDPLEALKDAIMSTIVVGLDVLEFSGKKYSIHIGDVGTNARIVEKYEKDPNRGMSVYAKYFLDEMRKNEPFEVQIETEDKKITKNALMVAFCNSRKYGTGIPLTKDGNPMDGKFEIVIIEDINISSMIKRGLAKFDERFLKDRNSTVIHATEAKVSFNRKLLLQLDGEVAGEYKQLTIRIHKGGVRLITHTGNEYLDDQA